MKRIIPLLLLCLANNLIVAQQRSPVTPAELTLIGTVLDDDTRKPVECSVVITTKDFAPLTLKTDSKGRFAIGVPTPSECTIIARAEGFESMQYRYSFKDVSRPDSILRMRLHLIPVEKVKLEGEILSSKDKTPLSCQIKVHLNSDFSPEDNYSIYRGSYSKTLTEFGLYILELSSPGFMTMNDTVWIANSHRRVIRKDYYLNPLEIGLTVQMTNIYFNFGESTLKPESFDALDKIADLFTKNSSLQFEIAGHTDSEGSDQYNLQLSQNRARAIADYLIGRGVKPSQLIVQGYGESKPIDSNFTAEGKLKNRRVEFIVASNTNQ